MDRPLTARIGPGGPAPMSDYAGARAALAMDPQELIDTVQASNLKGRGGAGFPTGTKWSFLPDGAPHPRYLVANADEMEPGTFKDRHLLEGDPHGLIEGMVAAAWAIRADEGFVFLRWAYREAKRRLRAAIDEAYEAGWLGDDIQGTGWSFHLHLHSSAGRYMAGEETGLLNALEGRRANPRAKPPYPQASGLFGQPTIVQNVETLYNVPHIATRGADWFDDLSRVDGEGGTKLYGVSGRVKQPGLWELPLGTPLRQVLEVHAGGMRDGLAFRGCLPGGASTDFLIPEHLDLPLGYAAVQEAGSRLGTGTLIVLDDQSCPVGMCANLERFFARESCGWCTPCRDGIALIAKRLRALEEGRGRPEDLEELDRHAALIAPPGRTYCALAPGAMEPLQSALEYFRDDFEAHVELGRCPYREA